jgi:hypothetical protein
MAALEIPEIIRFEVTVDEVIAVTQHLSRITKRGKARTALSRMLIELKRGNTALIEKILVPLTTIIDRKRFEADFPQLLSHFKKMYLGDRATLAQIHCHKVTLALEALRKAQEWKVKLGFPQAVVKLDLLTTKWIADDRELYDADTRMLEEINRFLNDIAGAPKALAYKEFKAGVAGLERSYKRARAQLVTLEVLRAKV